MEKRKLMYIFTLAFLLVITSIIIFSQSDFSKFNLTGFVTNSEGLECDGNWTQTLEECINGTQQITWTSSDSLNCTSPIIENKSCEMPITCSENWSCAEWTTCANSIQTRICTDSNSCGTIADKPNESQSCIICEEDWTCETWSECKEGNKTRICTDSNSCETIADKPNESQSCIICEEDWTCETWSECKEGNKTRICTDSNSCGTIADKPIENKICNEEETLTIVEKTMLETPTETSDEQPSIPSCDPNWKCGEWQECLNNKQIRVCLDKNNCNSNENVPKTSQECLSTEVKATCSDNIKNQGEVNVDCGGPCKKCSFLIMVGSVINGNTNKEGSLLNSLFSSTGKTLTTLLVLVVMIIAVSFLIIFLKSKKDRKSLKKLKLSKNKNL